MRWKKKKEAIKHDLLWETSHKFEKLSVEVSGNGVSKKKKMWHLNDLPGLLYSN